jgi:hypothetical protein
VRFAVELGPDVQGPFYVLLTASDGAPGWIRVMRDGLPVPLRERCDIADCGADPAVCGAAVPVVRDLAAHGRRIEMVWDGTTSVVDSAGRCERRIPAPAGTYTARFCHSIQAQPLGAPDSSGSAPGTLGELRCQERPFTLADGEVVLRL